MDSFEGGNMHFKTRPPPPTYRFQKLYISPYQNVSKKCIYWGISIDQRVDFKLNETTIWTTR